MSAKIFVPVEITPCIVKSINKINSIEPNLPKQFILGGPALPVIMPTFSQTPNCKYNLLFKDTISNFEITLKEEKWFIDAKSSSSSGLKSIKLRAFYDDKSIYEDVSSG